MSHFHLQLFATRFNEVLDDYLQQVNWIYEGAVPEIDLLVQAIDAICSKQHVSSPQSLAFGEISSCRDVLNFFDPIVCCRKRFLNSDTLMSHLLRHIIDGREELATGVKKTAILFNLFVQLGTAILDRYDDNYKQIEQYTAQLLRKAAEYLGSILRKAIRRDAHAANTFIEDVTFAKWKYVFDYTCIICTNRGIVNCRYDGAIAWFLIHLNTMTANPIRHLGTKMHAESLRNCLGDRNVAPTSPVSREVHPSRPQLSAATKYLMEVRESELDKLCTIGTSMQLTTPYEAVRTYLQAKLGSMLMRSTIEPFGSRVTAVANQDSDLDLAVKVDPSMQPKTAYQDVLAWASANDQEVHVERQISTGPLVLRLRIHSLQLTVDLTFNSPYVVGNAKIINYFFRLQPMARKLFFMLKEWKERIDIGQNFHNNVLTSMIVFYMQTEQYLPPITPLINGPQMVNNLYNTEFVELITLYALPNSFLELVKDFFNYWSRFDWTRTGASVKDAKVRPKNDFRNSNQPMMITDYFDVTRNVAGHVRPGAWEKFVRACNEAAAALEAKQTI